MMAIIKCELQRRLKSSISGVRESDQRRRATLTRTLSRFCNINHGKMKLGEAFTTASCDFYHCSVASHDNSATTNGRDIKIDGEVENCVGGSKQCRRETTDDNKKSTT